MNYSSCNYVVFWTNPHITALVFWTITHITTLVFWTITHIAMLSFEQFLSVADIVVFPWFNQLLTGYKHSSGIGNSCRTGLPFFLSIYLDMFVFWSIIPHVTMLSFQLFIIWVLNYSSFKYVVFWTISHIIMLSFELFLIWVLNYSSFKYVVFWTIPHIIMLSFEHFSSGVAAADFLSIDQYTHAVQWAERIKARPAVTRGLQVLSFELLFLIHLCCLLNYSSYNLLNYSSYNYSVFWTFPHITITILSFELFLI